MSKIIGLRPCYSKTEPKELIGYQVFTIRPFTENKGFGHYSMKDPIFCNSTKFTNICNYLGYKKLEDFIGKDSDDCLF